MTQLNNAKKNCRLKLYQSPNIEQFIQKIKLVVEEVTPIVDGNECQVLLHYSENDEISKFSNRGQFNWTNGLSTRPKDISRLIGFTSEKFRAIYIIKCFVGNSCRVVLNDHTGFASEAQVRHDINEDAFRALKIKYDQATGGYELK